MTLSEDVDLEGIIMTKDELSGAVIKVRLTSMAPLNNTNNTNNTYLNQAICTEAGLMALRERRMRVAMEDFTKAKDNVMYRKNEGTPEGLYL